VSYASGNLPARDLVQSEIASDTAIYPDPQTFGRLFTNTAYEERAQRVVTRLWTRIRTGR
jgi:putrescine transport system substrate-binding protein